MTGPSNARIWGKQELFGILLIIGAGLLAYALAFDAPFYFDDKRRILHHAAVINSQDWTKLWEFSPRRFLVYLTFAFNYQSAGANPLPFHVFNVIVHLLNGILVYLVTKTALKTPSVRQEVEQTHAISMAAAAALLFTVHPVQTQAVTYIVQRITVMAVFFYLLTVWLYLEARIGKRPLFYWLAVLSLFAGVFCKEIVFTVPVMLILCEVLLLRTKGEALNWPAVARRVSVFVLPIIVVNLAFLSAKSLTAEDALKAASADGLLSRKEYLLTQMSVICTYFRLFILPVNQNLDYAYPAAAAVLSLRTAGAFALLCFILIAAWVLIKRYVMISFGILWIFVALSVESSIIPIGDVIAEHRMYLPSAGFCLALVYLIYILAGRRLAVFRIAVLLIGIILSALTIARNYVWSNEIRLWEDVVSKSPEKYRPRLNLGNAYWRNKEAGKAGEQYRIVLGYEPRLTEAHNGLAVLAHQAGRYEEAISHYQDAIKTNPRYPNSYYNMGMAYAALGNEAMARKNFQKAVELNIVDVKALESIKMTLARFKAHKVNRQDAHLRLGEQFLERKNYDEAVFHLKQVVEKDPHSAGGHRGLSQAFEGKCDYEKALFHANSVAGIEGSPEIAARVAMLKSCLSAPDACCQAKPEVS